MGFKSPDGRWCEEEERQDLSADVLWSRFRREQACYEVINGLGVLQGVVEFFAGGIAS
jgi:hypothetical protein